MQSKDIKQVETSDLEVKQSFLDEATKEIKDSALLETKRYFEEMLDVNQFRPSEINVKISEGMVVVDAHHELQADEHGFIHRKFTRKFNLPPTVKCQNIVAILGHFGVLIIREDEKEESVPQTKLKSLRSPVKPIKKFPLGEKEKQASKQTAIDKIPQERKDGDETSSQKLKSLKSPIKPVKMASGKQSFKPGDEGEIPQKLRAGGDISRQKGSVLQTEESSRKEGLIYQPIGGSPKLRGAIPRPIAVSPRSGGPSFPPLKAPLPGGSIPRPIGASPQSKRLFPKQKEDKSKPKGK